MRAIRDDRWNYRILLGEGTLVDIGRQLAGPQLVLPYLYLATGAPIFFAGLLLPIVQVSKLISQVSFVPFLDAGGVRKWYMALTFIASATALGIVGVGVLYTSAYWLVVIFLFAATMIGLSQGFSNLLFQDVLGRALPPPSRSTLLYTQTALAGMLAIVMTLGSFHLLKTKNDALHGHLDLLWMGVVVITSSALMTTALREHAGSPPEYAATGGKKANGLGYMGELRQGIELCVSVTWFRRFLVARGLMRSIELALPFYAVHAAINRHQNGACLHTFVIASSLGIIIGAPLWRLLSRNSLSLVMAAGAAIAACGGFLALAIDFLELWQLPLLHAGVFLLVALASQGTKNASKVYLVDHAPEAERPYYIAIANTVAGALGVIMATFFGAIAHFQNVVWPIIVIVALNLLACLYATRLGNNE